MELRGKTALVTGAVGILGKAFCRALAAAGSDIVLIDSSKSALEAATADIVPEFADRRFLALSCDVRLPAEVRATVEFQRLNLMEPFAHLGTFSVIFCRNVMIYFDKPTQRALVNRLAACLEPGGYLFIGHAESLNGIDQPLSYVRPAIYRKAETSGTNTERGGGSR